MQSRISFFNKTIFKKNVTHFWPIWVLYTMVCMWLLPVCTYLNTNNYINTEFTLQTEQDYSKIIGVVEGMRYALLPVVIFVFALAAALCVFSYLFHTKNANMIHALPVRREELFCTNYISGLLFLIVPQIGAFLVTIFVWFLNGINHLEYLLQWLGIVSGISIFAYSLAVFALMLTGHIVVAPIYFILLNYGYMGICTVVDVVLQELVYGFYGTQEVRRISPLAPLNFLTSKIQLQYDNQTMGLPMIGGVHYVKWYVLAAVVFIVLALLIYKKRQLECAGDVIVIGWLKPLFRWSVAIIAAGVLSSFFIHGFFSGREITGKIFPIVLLSSLLFGITAFFMVEMIIEKRFMVFQRKRILESFGLGILMSAFLLVMELDVLGVEKHVPDKNEIEAVSVEGSYSIYTNKEARIQECRELQQRIIESKDEFETYFSKYRKEEDSPKVQLAICYLLKNGESVNRTYYLPWDEYYTEQKDSALNKFLTFENSPQDYLAYYFTDHYSKIQMFPGGTFDYADETGNFHSVELPTEDAEQLFTALKEDFETGNYCLYSSEITKERENNIYVNSLNFCFMPPKGARNSRFGNQEDNITDGKSTIYAGVILTKACEKTISVLEELGYLNDKVKMITEKELQEISSDTNTLID